MLTADRVRELLSYDPKTGVFRWRVYRGRVAKAGFVAGNVTSDGRVRICVAGRLYLAHRLAWLYTTGKWPTDQIDHKDGDPLNNRWNNLREANRCQNGANRRDTEGRILPKGVSRSGRGFRAEITAEGRRIYLGYYPTVSAAHGVYAAAARDLHGDFARVA